MKKLPVVVSNWTDRLNEGLAVSGGIILLLSMLLIGYGVVKRYLFRAPEAWAIELPSFMFLMSTALALAYVHRLRGHIGVEIVAVRMPEKVRVILQIVGSLALFVYVSFAVWGSWASALDHLRLSERSVVLGIPLFAVQLLLTIFLFLLGLQALVEISKDVTKLQRKQR